MGSRWAGSRCTVTKVVSNFMTATRVRIGVSGFSPLYRASGVDNGHSGASTGFHGIVLLTLTRRVLHCLQPVLDFL